MPVGTNGKAMLLLSGGIDSPVAGYMIAKRGVMIDGLFPCAAIHQREAKQKVVDLETGFQIFRSDQPTCKWRINLKSNLKYMINNHRNPQPLSCAVTMMKHRAESIAKEIKKPGSN